MKLCELEVLGREIKAAILAGSPIPDVSGLTKMERRFLSPFVADRRRGGPIDGTITAGRVAALLRILISDVARARGFLNKATPIEIQLVLEGKIRYDALEKRFRNRADTNVNRQLHANIWRSLRGALLELSDLPQPSDVAAIARAKDRGGVVDSTLLGVQSWLAEFVDAWTSPVNGSGES